MTFWEYKLEWIDRLPDHTFLNKYGAEGWELVALHKSTNINNGYSYDGSVSLYFKRRRGEGPYRGDMDVQSIGQSSPNETP